MTEEDLLRIGEILNDPLRKRILLQFGKYEKLSAETLLGKLKTEDPNQVTAQLNILENTTLDGEPLLTKQQDQYQLTQKGHDILIRYITHPEKFSKPKAKPKYYNLYWAALAISIVIVTLVVRQYITNTAIEKTAIGLTFALGILALAYYVRIRPPSRNINRIMYIFLVGSAIGSFLSIGAIVVLSRAGVHDLNATAILTFAGCYIVGGLIGEVIGRLRNYKGPQQYDW